jgi:HAD superfamily hydrolase (TIGR01458 family)
VSLPAWVRGLLLDVDGTLLRDDRPIEGGSQAIARLRAAGLPFRLLTNTTRRSRAATASVLRKGGYDVAPHEILTPAVLARRLILGSGRPRATLLIPEEARADLVGVLPGGDRPDWVVLGDLGAGFTWERLNQAFRSLRAGAALVALHRNPFWRAGEEEGEVLDAGAFVAALEYAAGLRAIVVGKPSVDFFRLALEEIGLEAPGVLVVGDDPATDGVGGRSAGCRVAIVRTGRPFTDREGSSSFRPDLVADSVADLV